MRWQNYHERNNMRREKTKKKENDEIDKIWAMMRKKYNDRKKYKERIWGERKFEERKTQRKEKIWGERTYKERKTIWGERNYEDRECKMIEKNTRREKY